MKWWPFKQNQGDKTPFVKEFLSKGKIGIPGVRAINQLEFTVLDTETTGLNPQQDYILSFGAVKVTKQVLQVATAVEWYPESPLVGDKTAAIHGLVDRKNIIKPKIFAQQLLEYVGQSIIVGHHIGFDLEMLLKITKGSGLRSFPNPILDTMNLAIRLDYGPHVGHVHIRYEEYSLDSLCVRYNIPVEDRHTAAGDAFLTAQLLLKLLKVATAKGVQTYGQLIR